VFESQIGEGAADIDSKTPPLRHAKAGNSAMREPAMRSPRFSSERPQPHLTLDRPKEKAGRCGGRSAGA